MEIRSNIDSVDAASTESVKEDKCTKLPPSSYRKALSKFQRSGWRAGALFCCGVALTVLLINVSVLIWTLSTSNMVQGIGTLYKGDCAQTKLMNTWLQFLINVLSTVLLGASNYCMQCLTSPTRQEVDEAHAKKKLLRIGVPSFRNLKAISRGRMLLWLGLCLSALPLHFLYNSTIFMTTQANAYTVLAGPSSFLRSDFNVSSFYSKRSDFNTSSFYPESLTSYPYNILDVARDFHHRLQTTSHVIMSNARCQDAYNHQYVSDLGDVFIEIRPSLRTTNKTECGGYPKCMAQVLDSSFAWNDSAMAWLPVPRKASDYTVLYSSGLGMSSRLTAFSIPSEYPSTQWLDQGYQFALSMDDYGEIQNGHADFFGDSDEKVRCHAESVPESCTLNFNLSFALVVIACNIIKLVTMSLTLRQHPDPPALVTTGDAINSFLRRPDGTTSGLCLFFGASMYLHWEWRRGSYETSLQWRKTKQKRLDSLSSPVYEPERWFWGQSASPMRWIMCFILCGSRNPSFIPVFIAGMMFLFKIIGQKGEFTFDIDPPVGKTLLPFNLSLFTAALLANLPQVLISYIYITFNNLFTCMLAGQEWLSFATRRQPLRVSSPTGQQRSTYWLQLPYTYSLPLLAFSTVLSWLASQSLFVVRVVVRDKGQLLPPNFIISTCGYSPGAIALTLILGTVIASGTIAVGLRRYPTGMPMSGTCSGAISAACHPSTDDDEVAMMPVQWGVTQVKDGVGHCSFSSKMVSTPVTGRRYD
ncbi:MAG: hypothetical protein Q9169_007142 [Polycauliona sp. 2 TL-2023]